MTHCQPLHRRSPGDRDQVEDEENLREQVNGDELTGSTVPSGVAVAQGHTRHVLGLAAVALLSVSALVLWLNLHLKLQSGDKSGARDWSKFTLPETQHAAPVDRRRWIGHQSSDDSGGNFSNGTSIVESGSISLSQTQRTPLGSLHSPQWPLFWILTAPQNEYTRCEEIIASWAQTVPKDSLVFIGAEHNRTSASGHRFVALPVPPDRKAIKELLAWQYVVKNFPTREWFVKGDDDTYFVVQNLNRYLELFDTRLPYYLGCKFHFGGPGGLQYVSGGAGYVLSWSAAQRLASAILPCLQAYGLLQEGDIAIAECLQSVGVFPEDTRDEHGRQRFHAFPYEYHKSKDWYQRRSNSFWYYQWAWGPVFEGPHCCGDDTSVSFHYMANKMRSFRFPDPGAAKTITGGSGSIEAEHSHAFLESPNAFGTLSKSVAMLPTTPLPELQT